MLATRKQANHHEFWLEFLRNLWPDDPRHFRNIFSLQEVKPWLSYWPIFSIEIFNKKHNPASAKLFSSNFATILGIRKSIFEAMGYLTYWIEKTFALKASILAWKTFIWGIFLSLSTTRRDWHLGFDLSSMNFIKPSVFDEIMWKFDNKSSTFEKSQPRAESLHLHILVRW